MKIVCLHQSADLYGSDRSFLQVVNYLKKSGIYSLITVFLPREGPLVEKLIELKVEVKFMNMSLLSKTYLKKLQWGKIIFPLLQFRKKLKILNQYDIVYANTSVILDFYALAPFIKGRKILHIREIPSRWLGRILSKLIAAAPTTVIFNSRSTQSSFDMFKDSVVIHNAFEGFTNQPISSEVILPFNPRPLKFLLIGRINSWKGQDFTINALSKIKDRNFTLKIVGSTSEGNEDLLNDLKKLVNHYEMSDKIIFENFQTDPEYAYQSSDVVLVPSTKPEPFGRIAIEAMSLGRPVIAANHGGLPEIVEHEISGLLFKPSDINSFNIQVLKYLNDPLIAVQHGIAAHATYLKKFSISGFEKKLHEVFNRK